MDAKLGTYISSLIKECFYALNNSTENFVRIDYSKDKTTITMKTDDLKKMYYVNIKCELFEYTFEKSVIYDGYKIINIKFNVIKTPESN